MGLGVLKCGDLMGYGLKNCSLTVRVERVRQWVTMTQWWGLEIQEIVLNCGG